MVRIIKILSSSRMYQKIAATPRIGLLLMCVALNLVIAVIWTKFFCVVMAGAVGAAAGFKLNEAIKTGNPIRDTERVWGIRRATVDVSCCATLLLMAVFFFLQGVFQQEGNFFATLVLISVANSFFAFSVSYFVLSLIRLDHAKHELTTATAEQSLAWEKEAAASRTSNDRAPFYSSWFQA